MPSDYWITYVEVDGEELNQCRVYYDASPAEPDVNWPGGLDIECVEYRTEDVTSKVSSEEMDSLLMRTEEHLNAMAEDYRY